jgi:hypothetical protein
MENQTIRMQMLAGLITENQYKKRLNEFSFNDSPDEDLPGNKQIIMFNEKDTYKQGGNTHGELSHTIKHFGEFSPNKLNSSLNGAINHIKDSSNLVVKHAKSGEIIAKGENAKKQLTPNAMLNTFDFINDKVKNNESLSSEEKELQSKFIEPLNNEYKKLIQDYISGGEDIDNAKEDEIKKLIGSQKKIKFTGSYKGNKVEYILDTSNTGLLAKKGDKVSTLFRIDKSGNNLGKVAGYLNRGVEITNPEFKKALDLNENLLEVTNQIPGNDNIIILISDYVKKHIMEHNKPGVGSIFKTGISENDIIKMVTNIAPKVSGDGGAYELKQSGIGYDLVLPIEKAKTLKNAKEGKVEKQEGPNKVKVPSITTSQPSSDFSTNKISLIIRKSNPQYLPDDVKNNKDIKKKIEEGKCYSLLTAFPGNPDIPRASEWKGKYAVVIPNGEGSLNEEFIRMQKLAGI